MATTDERLAQVPLFEGLSKKHLTKVSRLATSLNVEAGKVLIREGEVGLEFIIVLDGEVEVRRGDSVLATRGPGSFLGEIALIADRPRTATVVAKTPVLLDVIDVRAFRTLLQDEPEIASELEAVTARRLAELEAADQ